MECRICHQKETDSTLGMCEFCVEKQYITVPLESTLSSATKTIDFSKLYS